MEACTQNRLESDNTKPLQQNGKNKGYYNFVAILYIMETETKSCFCTITLQVIPTWRQCKWNIYFWTFSYNLLPLTQISLFICHCLFPFLTLCGTSEVVFLCEKMWVCWWYHPHSPCKVLSWSSSLKSRFWSFENVSDKCYFLLELMNHVDLVPGKHIGEKVLGKQMEIKIFQLDINQKRCMRSL